MYHNNRIYYLATIVSAAQAIMYPPLAATCSTHIVKGIFAAFMLPINHTNAQTGEGH